MTLHSKQGMINIYMLTARNTDGETKLYLRYLYHYFPSITDPFFFSSFLFIKVYSCDTGVLFHIYGDLRRETIVK